MHAACGGASYSHWLISIKIIRVINSPMIKLLCCFVYRIFGRNWKAFRDIITDNDFKDLYAASTNLFRRQTQIGVCERHKNIRQTRWQTIGSKKLLFYRLFFVYDRVNDWLKRVILASLTNANFNDIQNEQPDKTFLRSSNIWSFLYSFICILQRNKPVKGGEYKWIYENHTFELWRKV